jgi:NAD(P)-dependent dehydrogenase (short-subunit alcohol dehydrogenase family)
MQPYLNGKVALVTGVSSGLGWGTAIALAKAGATVVGLARRVDRGQALAAEIEAVGGRFEFTACNLGDVAQCQAAVNSALAKHGKIDILINNAAFAGDKPVRRIEDMDEDHWNKVLDTNLRAPFTMTRLVLPSMQEQHDGVIINIASINAVIGVANMAAYNASKAGLVHLTNTTAVENASHGIRANAIIMGGVESEMGSHVAGEMGRSVRGDEWSAPVRPTRGTAAEDLGRVLSLFCSDDARALTGAAIALDGGASAGGIASSMIYFGASQG